MSVLILGASGLIGSSIAHDLMRRRVTVVPVARRFNRAQRASFGAGAREISISQLDAHLLTQLVQESEADLVVNCLGLLQDAPGEFVRDIHLLFVERLLTALRNVSRPTLLVHVSIPGSAINDHTVFARSKREAERAIAQSGVPYAILRPGFVLAPAAYGGSAMLRALATLPFKLPARLAARPFAVVAVENIAETVAMLLATWDRKGSRQAVTWDLMHPDQISLGEVLARLRAWIGTDYTWRITVPAMFIKLGALTGDFAGWLGWHPPLRSTALAELQRGVTGDPQTWIAETGISPRSLDDILRGREATVQEKWFARLYALKAPIIVTLVIFWCASALIALTIAYSAAVNILIAHGYTAQMAKLLTIAGSWTDLLVGLAIGFRRTYRQGLVAGIALSLFYMLAAAIVTPDMWSEPLGALVKTFPAILLMLVALAIADER